MISNKHKCIFIHIPKCAGTSIEKKLGHFKDFSFERNIQDHRKLRIIEPFQLKNLFLPSYCFWELKKIYHKFFKINLNLNNKLFPNKTEYKTYFKFAVVRNPYTRVISAYKNIISDPIHLKNRGIKKNIDVNEFIKKFLKKDNLLQPATEYVINRKGEIELDSIIRFENLKEDFNLIAKKIKLKNSDLPFLIKSKNNKSNKIKINQNSLLLINKHFKKDFINFNYQILNLDCVNKLISTKK